MLQTRIGIITTTQRLDAGTISVTVKVDGETRTALVYESLFGDVAVGDQVLVNTTAADLKLGTGGYDFAITNLSHPAGQAGGGPGHIIKLRYTPLQFAVNCEEEKNPQALDAVTDLGGMPVVAAGLHSQVALIAAGIKAQCRDARVTYVMTDGAALPMGVSNLVRELLENSLIDDTITCGQAFGGGHEAVNLYTALCAARGIAESDIAVVCQGPGNVGTGTALGFSAIEVGQIINAAHALAGRPVAAVRMSQADKRPRHRLISHHTLTALSRIALAPALVALPEMDAPAQDEAIRQIQTSGVLRLHEVSSFDGRPGVELLERLGMRVSSMGRTFQDDPLFFLAASAAGRAAAGLL